MKVKLDLVADLSKCPQMVSYEGGGPSALRSLQYKWLRAVSVFWRRSQDL